MSEKFKILAEYVKDLSSETPNVETYVHVKNRLQKYNLTINIDSKPLKNKLIEVDTKMIFKDTEQTDKNSYFEIIYSTVIKLDENVKDKNEIQRIILSEVPQKIYPNLEKTFLDTVINSGFNEIKIEKKIDFKKLYEDRFN